MGLTRAIRRPRRLGSSVLDRSASRSAAALQLGSELKMKFRKLAVLKGSEKREYKPGSWCTAIFSWSGLLVCGKRTFCGEYLPLSLPSNVWLAGLRSSSDARSVSRGRLLGCLNFGRGSFAPSSDLRYFSFGCEESPRSLKWCFVPLEFF